jgi:hypothetical protein
MADALLEAIRIKTRRITQRLGEHHLSTRHLDQVINSALCDLHRDIRLLEMETYFNLHTLPKVGYYDLRCIPVCQKNFKSTAMDAYDAFGSPVTIDDRCELQWIQYIDEYKHICKSSSVIEKTISVDQSSGIFTVDLQKTINPFSLCIYYRSMSGEDVLIYDIPDCKNRGNLCMQTFEAGDLEGTIHYPTGKIQFKPKYAIDIHQKVLVRGESASFGMPSSIFKYGTSFFFYPIPDKVYHIQMKAMCRPILLLSTGEFDHIIEEYWQYLAFSAAKKLFEEQHDINGLNNILPAWNEQHIYIKRRKSNQRNMQRYSIRELFPQWRDSGINCDYFDNSKKEGCC